MSALLPALLALANPAAAQDGGPIAHTPGMAAVPAVSEGTLLKDGSLFARLLDTPPFSIGDARRARPAALPGLYAGFIVLQGVDGFSTTHGLAHGAAESNPLVRWAVQHPASLWAVKGATATAAIVVAERLWTRHHRAQAVTVMVVSNVVMGIVASQNLSAIRAAR